MFEEKPGWVREKLQEYGTKVGRDGICKDIWIRQIKLWIKIQLEGIKKIGSTNLIPLFVIQDIRFLNELEFVSSFPKSLIIRVHAPERHQLRCKQENGNFDTHISETQLDDAVFPFYFFNDNFGDEEKQTEQIITKYLYYLKTIA